MIHPCVRLTDGRAIAYSALSRHRYMLLCCRALNMWEQCVERQIDFSEAVFCQRTYDSSTFWVKSAYI